MRVSSTEIQNNFSKYLMLAGKEPIIITENGIKVAQLTSLISEKENEFMVAETSRNDYSAQKASYERYLELSKEGEKRYEYIDGEIYVMASPRTTHQQLLQILYIFFHNFFQNKDCTTMIAPYDITLKRYQYDKNVVQPDLMVICDLKENLDENDYYQGTPALVIEVLSESSRNKDMIKKLDLYIDCGIKEYWIVNPEIQEVILYLGNNCELKDYKTYRKPEIVNSFIFENLTVKLDEIFFD